MRIEAEVVRYGLDGEVTDRVVVSRDTGECNKDVVVTVRSGEGRVDGYEMSAALRAVMQ